MARDPEDRLRILGVDIETCASAFVLRNKLVQIGVFDSETRQLFRMDVGWKDDEFDTDLEVVEKVHHISRERTLASPPASTVDATLIAFLDKLGVGPKRGIAVGFNVAGFDMNFVRRDLPFSAARFSYRTIDLNAICFAIGKATGVPWERIKKVAVQAAKEELAMMVPDLKAHDAGWDAMCAVLVFEFLAHSIREKKGGASVNNQKVGLGGIFLTEATFGGWFAASTGPTALGVVAAGLTVIALILFARYFFTGVV